MTEVAEYLRYCGPGAFAAVTGCPRDQAAKALIHWSRHCGWSPDTGTSPNTLAIALLSRGYRIETWGEDAGGWRTETADEFAKRIWANARRDHETCDRLVSLIAESQTRNLEEVPQELRDRVREDLESADKIREYRRKRRQRRTLTVQEWCNRFTAGCWILFVHQHVAVVRGGSIIAGEIAGINEATIHSVWRIVGRSF